MILHSTGRKAQDVTLAQAVANGLAPDGGLYMPDSLPSLPKALFNNIDQMSLREIGYVVMTTLIGDIVAPSQLKRIVDDALDFDMPMRPVGQGIYTLELFHGPTHSFKDVGARFMASLLPVIDPAKGVRRDIIVATSGDSGGALANSFARAAGTRVVVVYPRHKLTSEQISQFVGHRNVLPVEVDGNFDVCQNLVKQILLEDRGDSKRRVTSGNSINLLRQLPSIIYYFYGYASLIAREPDTEIVMAVPCGNLGNLSAALMAKQMGLPVKRFIAANNANDAFVEYLKTGGLRPRRALMTVARAMDVGNPSNLARIIDLYGNSLESLRNDVTGVALSDPEIAEALRHVAAGTGIVFDPQSAAAYAAAKANMASGEKALVMAGAHPAKFRNIVETIVGHPLDPSIRPQAARRGKTTHFPTPIVKIPPTIAALRRTLEQI